MIIATDVHDEEQAGFARAAGVLLARARRRLTPTLE